jgi:hypothetical protein
MMCSGCDDGTGRCTASPACVCLCHRFPAAVREMRRLQCRSAGASSDALLTAKERETRLCLAMAAERRVDKMLEELDAPPPVQGSLKL